jgi:catechol 2,3-dioxygenase-like lactoylglutathione lyase family enzyme
MATPFRRQQPETLRLREITPSFTVNDVKKSLAWYRDGLGFFLAERWEKDGKLEGVMLKAGTCHLALSQDDFSQGQNRAKGLGFRIWCETLQDVDEIAARLRAVGGTFLEQPGERWDAYGFTAEDPDGFKISVSRPKD